MAVTAPLPPRSMPGKSIPAIAFVLRCSGAAAAAYELASALGLPEPLWATMSAIIVSQEQLHETLSSLTGRVLGTVLGIAVTVLVSGVTSRAGVPIAAQMAVAVAICALAARKFPRVRVAMWTCPIILLTAQPDMPIVVVALHRGGEVILGALVGWACHWAAEILVDALTEAAGRPRVRR